jgi:hypothetical protein
MGDLSSTPLLDCAVEGALHRLQPAPLHAGIPAGMRVHPVLEVERPQVQCEHSTVIQGVQALLDALLVGFVGPLRPVLEAPVEEGVEDFDAQRFRSAGCRPRIQPTGFTTPSRDDLGAATKRKRTALRNPHPDGFAISVVPKVPVERQCL